MIGLGLFFFPLPWLLVFWSVNSWNYVTDIINMWILEIKYTSHTTEKRNVMIWRWFYRREIVINTFLRNIFSKLDIWTGACLCGVCKQRFIITFKEKGKIIIKSSVHQKLTSQTNILHQDVDESMINIR